MVYLDTFYKYCLEKWSYLEGW